MKPIQWNGERLIIILLPTREYLDPNTVAIAEIDGKNFGKNIQI